ncbi:MAG TPA: hypothetical protein VJX28_07540 [Chthoniobacterales bacterium]|nr:hypothetical protein [Chthoniobacterales bacterium]
MKRQRAVAIFLAVLFVAALIYYFITTNQPRGMMIDGIVDANQVVVSPKVQGHNCTIRFNRQERYNQS